MVQLSFHGPGKTSQNVKNCQGNVFGSEKLFSDFWWGNPNYARLV